MPNEQTMISKDDTDFLKLPTEEDKVKSSSNKFSEGLSITDSVKQMGQLINLMIV